MKKSNKQIKDNDLYNVSGGARARRIDPQMGGRRIDPQLAGPKAGGLIKDDDELDNVHGGTKSPPLKDDVGKDRGIDISPLASKKKKEKNNPTID